MSISFRTVNGFYLCAEGGGGDLVMADRVAVGPWEGWTPVLQDDNSYALLAHDGVHYLTAVVDGTVEAKATEVNDWERFALEIRGASVAFKTAHGSYLQAPLGGGPGIRLVHAAGAHMPGEWEFFTPSAEFWDTTPQNLRPFFGPLRVQDKLFYDDNGPRRVLFASWFPALRILRDSPEEFYRQLDAITMAGYQGIRVFLCVGGWDDYWNGREVAPVTFTKWFFTGSHLRTDSYSYTVEAWPDYDDLLRELLQACKERQLRLHLTTGDMQIICPDPSDEIDLHRRIARICAEEGGLEVVSYAETTNEFPLNRAGGDSDESIEQMGRIIDIWQAAIPGIITAQGAIPQNEEPDSLDKASTYGTVCAVHVTRDPFPMCLKRTLGLVWWEGDYRAFWKGYWSGEQAGPGPDSYAPINDPAELTALTAMTAIIGMANNWFQGAGVRSHKPLESEWGFLEMPALMANLPEDVATWQHASDEHGGIAYWFSGNRFATASYKDWNPNPPRPIKDWVLYTGTEVIGGTGTPPPFTGMLLGNFA